MPVPPDFAARAPYVTVKAALRISGWTGKRTTLRRWEMETGIRVGSLVIPSQAHNHGLVRPIPPDFAELAPTMYMTEALDRWKATWRTIYKWEDETGARCRRSGQGLSIDADRRQRHDREKAANVSRIRDDLGITPAMYRLAMGAWRLSA